MNNSLLLNRCTRAATLGALFILAGCPATNGFDGDTGPRDVPTDRAPTDVATDVATDTATDVATDASSDVTNDAGCTADEQCDDGDPCTANLCDRINGACGFRRMMGCCTTDTQCDDGNVCTMDRCDMTARRCANTARMGCCRADTDCNDGNACTRDSCNLTSNTCEATAIAECCRDGDTRACYSGAMGTAGVGLCVRGTQRCVGNRYDGQPCMGEVTPAATESCDAARADENCNGMANEGCTCSGSETRACYTGPVGTEGRGLCRGGMQTCSGGAFGMCMGQTLPGTDICGNGIDEDCDGSDRACPPANDDRAAAVDLTVRHSETVAMGTTVGATHDGPSVDCGCTSGGNVWYRFTLTSDSAIYLDTASMTDTFDTSLFLTDAAGVAVAAQPENGSPNAGLCNDDGGCGGVTGWGTGLQSRTWGFLRRGTYYVAVGGCGSGAFTLRLQHIPTTEGSFFYETRITGDNNETTFLIGSNQHSGTCGGRISGEDVRWFVTCGAPQFFSLCESDGGAYVSRATTSETTRWDPVLYTHSGITGVESVCGDMGAGGTDCRGRVGTGVDSTTFDTVSGGSRLNNVAATRGLNAILVDERTRGSGMEYRLVWRLRDR